MELFPTLVLSPGGALHLWPGSPTASRSEKFSFGIMAFMAVPNVDVSECERAARAARAKFEASKAASRQVLVQLLTLWRGLLKELIT